MSNAEKITDGLRDAIEGRFARLTVYVGLGRERVTFDSEGAPALVERRYRREGHPRWRTVPAGKRRDRIVADACEKAAAQHVKR